MKELLPLLLTLLAIAVVMYMSYLFTKFVGSRSLKINGAHYMRVIDRLAVGQDKSVIILEVCGKYYLISAAAGEIRILKELDDFVPAAPAAETPSTFAESFKTVISNMMKPKK